ncbi:HAD hydrolase-like protein [Planosporangium flavigriseum]|uniref:Haloacid dehalogenase n=1 Tax=Planosporangium flavigriseum TaxID=373681 RepID=A0A8J3LLD9_9ACTN|nr:haloacid dehalogenase-like hydrolase [Planosporangium flavigriseum]NJC65624.1 HAD hydrolase-like protein [Planosporangium flavigriseum]GIG74787.1 haloacid dehalogenase [Planosporangium flavigriseum]
MTGGVLVLWDVDHTLVDAAGVGARAFRIAFRQLFGRDDTAPLPPMAGRTDRAIAIHLLAANGVADPDRHLEDFRLAAEQALAGLEGVLRAEGRALPGALAALMALRDRSTVQTLLTGNLRAFAEAKMRAFDLSEHLDLDIGVYGWAHAVRARLVDLARSAARVRHEREYPGRATVLVGDTPLDVEAALASGAAVVAVATGRYTAAELRNAGAHAVLADLADTEAVLEAISAVAEPI